MASCVMVEELGQWRAALVHQLRAGEAALQDLLTEHVELGRALRAVQEELWQVHASFAASLQCEGPPRGVRGRASGLSVAGRRGRFAI